MQRQAYGQVFGKALVIEPAAAYLPGSNSEQGGERAFLLVYLLLHREDGSFYLKPVGIRLQHGGLVSLARPLER